MTVKKTHNKMNRHLISIPIIAIAGMMAMSTTADAVFTKCESKNFSSNSSCKPFVPGQDDCPSDTFVCDFETWTQLACVTGPGWCTEIAGSRYVTATVKQRRCNVISQNCLCNVDGVIENTYTYSREVTECY